VRLKIAALVAVVTAGIWTFSVSIVEDWPRSGILGFLALTLLESLFMMPAVVVALIVRHTATFGIALATIPISFVIGAMSAATSDDAQAGFGYFLTFFIAFIMAIVLLPVDWWVLETKKGALPLPPDRPPRTDA
jgi:hypothetical protein